MTTDVLTTEHHQFFDHIIASPDDDAPRLAFADWLDAQGNVVHSDFIRVQCEMDTLSIGSPRWKELRRRERTILRDHPADWFGKLYGRLKNCYFRRGLLHSVRLHAEVFVQHPGKVFGFGPINMVKLDGGAAFIQQISDLFYLRYVTMLDLSSNKLLPNHISILAQSRSVTNLNWLNLRDNQLGTDGAVALANSPSFIRLESLRLENTEINDDGLLALAESSHLPSLKCVYLSSVDCRYRGMKRLVERYGNGVIQSS